jgi:hypothetical protein
MAPIVITYITAVGKQRLNTTDINEITPIATHEPLMGGWLANLVQRPPPKFEKTLRQSIKVKAATSNSFLPKFIEADGSASKPYLTKEFEYIDFFLIIPYSK